MYELVVDVCLHYPGFLAIFKRLTRKNNSIEKDSTTTRLNGFFSLADAGLLKRNGMDLGAPVCIPKSNRDGRRSSNG